MRRFILMRHAKAERGEGKPDFQRTLDERGWRDANAVAGKLANLGIIPDCILCSSARRTRDTLAAVMPHFGADCTIHLRRDLYEAEGTDVRDAVRTASGQCILLIGHNPAIHMAAMEFAGRTAADVGLYNGFPTSHAAVFSMGFAIDTVKFERIITP